MGDSLIPILLPVTLFWCGLGSGVALLLTRGRSIVVKVLAILFALACASIATSMSLFLW